MEEEYSMKYEVMQEKRYLLSIEEFLAEESGGRLMEEAFLKVDSERRGRARRMKMGRTRAACLGAGLLLQLAVQEAIKSSSRENLSARNAAKNCGGEHTMQDAAKNCGGEHTMQDAAGNCSRALIQKKAAGSTDGQNQVRQHMVYGLTRYTVSQIMKMISSPLSLTYQYGKNGKPYFREYPFFFNLSHSGDFVFCALSLREIGADIQQHQKCGRERIAGRFFSEEEQAVLKTKTGDDAFFFRLWARKEAFGKLTGAGITGAIGVNLLPEPGKLPENVMPSEPEKLPENIMPSEPGKLFENKVLPENRKLLWEEYEEIRGYSLAVCQYFPEISS